MSHNRSKRADRPTTNGNGQRPPSSLFADPLTVNAVQQLLAEHAQTLNATLASRQSLIQQNLLDPRRDIDAECGYPLISSAVGIEIYRQLWEREGIAAQVVQAMPNECWGAPPDVYEDEDEQNVTDFEEALDGLELSADGGTTWHDGQEGGTIWGHCKRVDILSRIGHFGVMLLGFDDGRPLQEPTDGVEIVTNRKRVKVTKPVFNVRTGKTEQRQTGWKFVRNRAADKALPPEGPPAPGERQRLQALLERGTLTVNSYEFVDSHKKDGRGQAVWEWKTKSEERPADFQNSSVTSNELIAQCGGRLVRNGLAAFDSKENAERFFAGIQETVGYSDASKCVVNGNGEDVTEAVVNRAASSDNPFLHGNDVNYGWESLAPSAFTASGKKGRWGKPSTGIESASGTDQQYFGVMFGPSEAFSDKPSKKETKLNFVRCFDESLVQIVRYEWNVNNPRFGRPVMYRITLNDPREIHTGIGLPLATVFVHWSRVIHVHDDWSNATTSPDFAVPAMRPNLNRILDIRKILAADAEGYWRNSSPMTTFETQPQLGGDVDVDRAAMQDELEQMFNGLQKWSLLRGMTAKQLPPAVTDPTPHVEVQMQQIALQMEMPMRILRGSAPGSMGGKGDADDSDARWNDKIRGRQNGYCTPRIVCALIDRLIQCGVLPEPESYIAEWPDLDTLSDLDRGTYAQTMTAALSQFVTSGAEAVVPQHRYLTKILGWTDEEAEEDMDAIEAKQEEDMLDQQDLMDEYGMIPAPPEGAQYPEPQPPVAPVSVKPGEALVHPQTGATVAKGPPLPKPTKNTLVDDFVLDEFRDALTEEPQP